MQPPVAEPRLTRQEMSVPRLLEYRKLSDAALVSKARSGDDGALATLVERHAPRVNRIAAQVLGDLEDARDAAQESLVKLCTRLRQFRGDSQFATWLHRLVVNTCHDLLARKRTRSCEPLPDAEVAAGDDCDPSRSALVADLRRDLVAGLARLSADQRAVVILRDALGLPYEEIARRVKMPVGTVKCYVHRGRARLRTEPLEEHSAA